MSGPPVIYPPWTCRTDEAGSLTCKRHGVWRIRSAARLEWTPGEDMMEWEDYACSIHLTGLLSLWTHEHPVIIDRYRQGHRSQ